MTVAQTTTEAAILRGVRKGDRGPIVSSLRTMLGRVGFPSTYGPADPMLFDVQLEQLVRGFQTLRRLQVDGIVGPKTWAALGGPPIVAPTPPPVVQNDTPAVIETTTEGPSGMTKLLGVAALAVGGYFALKKYAPNMLSGLADSLSGGHDLLDNGVVHDDFDDYGARDDLSPQEQAIYDEILAKNAKARGRVRVTHPGMTDEQKKAAQRAAATRNRHEKDDAERLARIMAARRPVSAEWAKSEADMRRTIAKLVEQGYSPWDAETKVRREMFLPGGPTTAGERAASATKRALIDVAAERVNPVIEPYLDPENPTDEEVRLRAASIAAAAAARSREAGVLLRSGYGPVSLPSTPNARVKPSVMRRSQDVFPLSPTDALIRAQGTSPDTYPVDDRMTAADRAELIETRRADAAERAARAAAIAAPRYDPSMRKGNVLVIEVDAARYDTGSPLYDKAYRIAKNDEAIAAARKAMLPVQLRAAEHSITRDTPLVLPEGAFGPSAVDPAYVRHMLRVRPDRDPGQEGQTTARGGETKFYPSSVLQRQMGPEASSHRILFAWDPRKAKKKLDGLGDMVSDSRIAEAARLATRGDCEKAVPQLLRVRGLVNRPNEALMRRTVRVVHNQCRDELESAIEDIETSRPRFAKQASGDITARVLNVVRGPRSGAQKRAKGRPLNPDKPWGPVTATPGYAPLVEDDDESSSAEASVFGPWRSSPGRAGEQSWPVNVRVLTPGERRSRAAVIDVQGPVYALPRRVDLPSLTNTDPWERRLREREIERLAVAAALSPGRPRAEAQKAGRRIMAKEIVVPADGSAPYYFVTESAGKGKAPRKKKREVSPEAMQRLPPPIMVTTRKATGDRIFRYAAFPF
jgi:hypothetical protein